MACMETGERLAHGPDDNSQVMPALTRHSDEIAVERWSGQSSLAQRDWEHNSELWG